ncbi:MULTISPECIES: signal peptidase II [Rhodobacterales]|uniref:Lipoprotein signal peptidase n=1 Tax=Tropicimonas isoalkanivorans TaxID=441112 RepID=A0A1I1F7V6_9RHOB|nr:MULTISPECIES: signal peptidase II [Rhodobacterales]MBM9592976.1 signal peptidase II [Roseitranquillus sediminis]SFB95381.1 signal peptidase II [Tropicimonas isoalkanivorans]
MNVRGVGIACAVAAFALDQGSKAFALRSPALANGLELLPVLNLVLVENRGVSFGMLSGIVPWWALVLLAFAIVAWLSVWLWRAQGRVVSAALGLIIGGALGNVADRMRFQAVTDFLDFHLGAYHWPAFNLADVAVVCGATLLILDSFRAKDERRRAEA